MVQSFPIALAEVRAGNKEEKLQNEICQVIYFFIKKGKLWKSISQCKGFNKVITQYGYYILELWKELNIWS